jgi:hypothetical protein
MAFIEPDYGIGLVLKMMTDNLTGDVYMSMILVFLALLITATAVFGIPMEFAIPIIFPFVLIVMGQIEPMVALGATLIFFMAAIVAKHLFFTIF